MKKLKIFWFIAFVTSLCFNVSLYATKYAVATTGMVADMVKSVGGKHVDVHAMMGANVDPHLYKPTTADIAALSKADIIFYNGLHLEGRMTDILERLEEKGQSVHAITHGIGRDRRLIASEEGGEFPDPHVWFDPRLWSECVPIVVEALIAVDADNATAYRENGERVRQEYLGLYDWAKKRIAELPESSRILVTSHDAYNYFGKAFNFKVVGVQGITTVSEAGLADITATVDFIKQNNIKAIFVESSVSPAAIQRISLDSGAKIGGEIFSDAMGTPGHVVQGPDGESYDEGTYRGMIMHNVNTIVEALK